MGRRYLSDPSILPYLEAMLGARSLAYAAHVLLRFTEEGPRIRKSLAAMQLLVEQADRAKAALAAMWALHLPSDNSHDTSDRNPDSETFFDTSVAPAAAMLIELDDRWRDHLEVLTELDTAANFALEPEVYAELARSRTRGQAEGASGSSSRSRD